MLCTALVWSVRPTTPPTSTSKEKGRRVTLHRNSGKSLPTDSAHDDPENRRGRVLLFFRYLRICRYRRSENREKVDVDAPEYTDISIQGQKRKKLRIDGAIAGAGSAIKNQCKFVTPVYLYLLDKY